MTRFRGAVWTGATAVPLALAAACANVEPSAHERFAATGELIALSGAGAGASNACFTCHGLDGLGNGAGAPRLAGLSVGYLERQMRAYADGRRQHPKMGWIAKRLDASEHLAVADYYANMPYRPANYAVPASVPALYVRGDPDRGLQACAVCHGLAGQGVGPANPAIGGQPAAYLEHQMRQWRESRRRTDPGNVMLRISQLLTEREIAVLAAYSARLPGDLPRPESPAAFRAERRDDPRSDVSAPLPRAVAR
jgi:cytochrome c553